MPDEGPSNPAQSPRSVVLPLPDGPTIEQLSPSASVNETSCRTFSE